MAITRLNIEFSGLKAVNATRQLNRNYEYFVEYKSFDKLIFTSGIIDNNKNTVSSKVNI